MAVIRGVIGLVRLAIFLIALTIFVGTILFNPIFAGIVGGIVNAEHMRSQGTSEVREKYFRVICTRYFEASFIERWTTPDLFNSGWCEDYKHRL